MKLTHLISMVLTTSFFAYAGEFEEVQKEQDSQGLVEIKAPKAKRKDKNILDESLECSLEKGPLSEWSVNQRKFDRKTRASKQKLVSLPNDPSYFQGYKALGITIKEKFHDNNKWVRGELPINWSVSKTKPTEGGRGRKFSNENKAEVMRIFHYYRKDAAHQATDQDECTATFIGKEKKVEKFIMQQQF